MIHWEKYNFGDWILIHRVTGDFIGFCGFDAEIYCYDQPNLGYAIKQLYWGKGFANEAVSVSISHGFNFLNFNSISAFVNLDNVNSKKILEKNEMVFEKKIEKLNSNRLLYLLDNGDYQNNKK
jgi:ribosomal-protein-alanine N-acetyltransferase